MNKLEPEDRKLWNDPLAVITLTLVVGVCGLFLIAIFVG